MGLAGSCGIGLWQVLRLKHAWSGGVLLLILAAACSAQVKVTEFYTPPDVVLGAITSGPDGNLWFKEAYGNIGRITTSGVITKFPLPNSQATGSSPQSDFGTIASGPDGNLWFTESYPSKIGRITTSGVYTEFPLPNPNNGLGTITSGPDGNLWFTSNGGIGRITTSGVITFPAPNANIDPGTITSGPDGNLWFTDRLSGNIGRITTSGVVSFPAPNANLSSGASAITSGPDGNLWFTESCRTIGRITTSGVITEFPVPGDVGDFALEAITSGSDGNLWFIDQWISDVEPGSSRIGRITTSGVVTFPIPALERYPQGITSGPDGNVWFTEGGVAIARIVPGSAGSSTPLGVTPAAGSGPNTTFTFTFSDTSGWQNLSVVNVLINNSLDARQACYLGYVVGTSTLVLVDDAGDAGGPYAGLVTLGNPGAVIQNGQCAVSLVGVGGSGSILTLVLNISFNPGFSGNHVQYLAAQDASSNSGWQALGVWNVPSASPPPSIVVGNMTPARSVAPEGTAQSFTFTLLDSKGASDIGILNVLVSDSLDGRHACYLAYVAPTNALLLVDDAGDAGGPFAGGMLLNGFGATIQNSQCSIVGTGLSLTASGNLLTLTLNIAFQTPFAGNHVLWVAGRDIAGGNNTGWQAMGTVSVQ